jgi:hypothetical protein
MRTSHARRGHRAGKPTRVPRTHARHTQPPEKLTHVPDAHPTQTARIHVRGVHTL